MKKKIILVSVAVALIAIAVVGGTLAWFNDTDEVTNVFTVGSIDIEQNEVFDEDTALLLPVVGTDPTDDDDNYIQKTVTVENVGKNAAYVQTYVAVPAVLDNNGILKLYDVNATDNGWTKVDGDANVAGVQPVATGISIDGEDGTFNVYLYRYNTALAKDAETDACLEYVYIDSSVNLNTYDSNNDGDTDTAYFVLANGTEINGFNAAGELHVLVATQATQADGFDSATEGLTATFSNHPWAD